MGFWFFFAVAKNFAKPRAARKFRSNMNIERTPKGQGRMAAGGSMTS